MERRASENRLKGLRKTAGTAFLAVSLVACGSNATETQKPTSLPTETPMPTMTFVPSEMPSLTPSPTIEITPAPTVTPSPTIEITPSPTISPTPEATPLPKSPITREGVLKDLEAFQNGTKNALNKYKIPVTLNQFKADYNAFIKSPSSNLITFLRDPKFFANCLDPKIKDPEANSLVRDTACTSLTYYTLKVAEISGGDAAAVIFAKDLMSYDVNIALKDKNVLIMLIDDIKANYW